MTRGTVRSAPAERWIGRRGLVLLMVAVASAAVTIDAVAADEAAVKMSPQTRQLLESLLDQRQLEAMDRTLSPPPRAGREAPWRELGPHPTGEPEPLSVSPPARKLELTIPDDVEGSGTADDPYVDVISGFLARFEYEPTSIEAYRSYPAEGEVEQYMRTLDYEPAVVRVPEGHYRETTAAYEWPYRFHDRRLVAVDVPPGIWLEGEGRVVVEPAVEPETRSTLINLNIRAGLVNVTLDGSAAGEFEPEPETRVNAVTAAHEAVIADSHIHDFTNRGITAVGNRGREGSDVIVVNNIIEDIGYSGISSQSRWLIRDNQIRYAGVLRPTGGGGDDGIIPRWGVEGEIVNNLVILERRPHARHVISGQTSHEMTFAGNVSIAVGPTRNNIGLSDGSHHNRVIGNVALTTGDPTDSAIQAGVSVNGYGTLIQHNVSIGSVRAFRAIGREGEEAPLIVDNYAEYSKPGHWSSAGDFHRGRHYNQESNTIRQLETHLPDPEPERFGFFVRDRQPRPLP